MDAVEYFKEATRMCNSVKNCPDCPFNEFIMAFPCGTTKEYSDIRSLEEAIKIVEKWSAEHPKKTRQSEFLKMFPNARLDEDGKLPLNPCNVDSRYMPKRGCVIACNDCRKEYWSEEVE